MQIVKIIDYDLMLAKPADMVALNTGKNCSSRLLNISGINGQTLKMKVSNDGKNWSYVQNEEGNGDYEITEDTSIPLISNECLLQLESNSDASGITASIGLKRK